MKHIIPCTVALAMLLITGCDNINRSLLFYTQTNAGLEVGIDPASQSGKVLIGYKRAEGVVNPVYVPPDRKDVRYSKKVRCCESCERDTCCEESKCGTCSQWCYIEQRSVTERGYGKPEDHYREEAYSVMAKIAGEANGRGSTGQAGEVEAAGKIAQWFATGEAAKLLAKNEYAAAALTGSSETAKAITSQKLNAERFGDSVPDSGRVIIRNVLNDLARNKNDSEAQKLLNEVNTAVTKAWPLQAQWQDVTGTRAAGYTVQPPSLALPAKWEFSEVNALINTITNAATFVDLNNSAIPDTTSYTFDVGGSSVTSAKSAVIATQANKNSIDATHKLNMDTVDKLKAIYADSDVQSALASAITYWYSKIVTD